MATPGGISGIFSTSNTYFQTDHAKKSFAAQIARLMPNGSALLFGLTSMLGEEKAVATEHGYFAKTMVFPSATISSASGITAGTSVTNSTSDTLTVASTSNIVAGMVLQVMQTTGVPTGENVLVTSVTDSTTLVVQRNIANSTYGVAMANGMTLYQIGSAYEEASTRPAALGIITARITNYTQIFRNSWANSGSNMETEMIAGDSNTAENRMDCAAFHAADIEKAIFFGRKINTTKNSQPLRLMDGLISILSDTASYGTVGLSASHITTASSTTNATQLETALDPCFDQATDPKAANERLLFVGGAAKRVLNNIGKLNGTYQLTTQETTWGLQFSVYNTARGSFKVIEHPLLNSNTAWAKMAIAVDPASIRLAYLGNRKTKNEEYNMNGTPVDSGVDAVGGTLTTECTLVCKNPPANAIIYNLTAAAAG